MERAKLYTSWEDGVEFAPDGPMRKKLIDTPEYTSVLVRMEEAQSLPPHTAMAGTYHAIQGSSRMTAGDAEFEVGPGATVVIPEGAPRGVRADTRLVFLASPGAATSSRRTHR